MTSSIPTLIDLTGKSALITGASVGIGRATTILFRQLGASVIAVARNLEQLKSLTEECEKIKTNVNNAGILEKGSILDTNLEQYDRVLGLNLRAQYNITQKAAKYLIEAKGNIVNVSSVNGIRSFPGVLAYNISKSGLDQMTSCVALELASAGVRVNSVNPGVTVTELHLRSGMNNADYEKFLEHSKTTHALGRAGEAKEVANAIAFLASDAASFITGVTLPVDGGRHAMCPR
uniref:Uncharacterized protein n=1 Tax=Panagrolaimus sp. ES5 TaxID=591445 RepID=A0AC34G8Y5_9BILA